MRQTHKQKLCKLRCQNRNPTKLIEKDEKLWGWAYHKDWRVKVLLIFSYTNRAIKQRKREKVCRDLEEGGLGFGITLTVSTMSPFSRFPGKLFTNPFSCILLQNFVNICGNRKFSVLCICGAENRMWSVRGINLVKYSPDLVSFRIVPCWII